jgi:hypothetical protein
MIRSVGVVIVSSKDKVVLAGDYSSPGDELNRLTRIPTSMVRAVRTLEKKPYLGEWETETLPDGCRGGLFVSGGRYLIVTLWECLLTPFLALLEEALCLCDVSL